MVNRSCASSGIVAHICLESLPHLVHDLRPNKHIVEIHPECTPKTNHSYDRAICVCVDMVLTAVISLEDTAMAQE